MNHPDRRCDSGRTSTSRKRAASRSARWRATPRRPTSFRQCRNTRGSTSSGSNDAVDVAARTPRAWPGWGSCMRRNVEEVEEEEEDDEEEDEEEDEGLDGSTSEKVDGADRWAASGAVATFPPSLRPRASGGAAPSVIDSTGPSTGRVRRAITPSVSSSSSESNAPSVSDSNSRSRARRVTSASDNPSAKTRRTSASSSSNSPSRSPTEPARRRERVRPSPVPKPPRSAAFVSPSPRLDSPARPRAS